ncbi:uncharacterized protein LOC144712111 [Wolffia australiana]
MNSTDLRRSAVDDRLALRRSSTSSLQFSDRTRSIAVAGSQAGGIGSGAQPTKLLFVADDRMNSTDLRRSEADDRLAIRRSWTSSLQISDRTRPIAVAGSQAGSGAKPAKLLLKVTVQRNLWPVLVVMSPESSVEDLIKASVAAYVGEGRRPALQERDSVAFELHYSQFCMESLRRDEKVMNLGSRSFFLRPKPVDDASSGDRCVEDGNRFFKVHLPLSRYLGVAFRL